MGWAGQPAHPKATAETGRISWLWENINPRVPTDSLQGKIFSSKESKDCKTERDRPGAPSRARTAPPQRPVCPLYSVWPFALSGEATLWPWWVRALEPPWQREDEHQRQTAPSACSPARVCLRNYMCVCECVRLVLRVFSLWSNTSKTRPFRHFSAQLRGMRPSPPPTSGTSSFSQTGSLPIKRSVRLHHNTRHRQAPRAALLEPQPPPHPRPAPLPPSEWNPQAATWRSRLLPCRWAVLSTPWSLNVCPVRKHAGMYPHTRACIQLNDNLPSTSVMPPVPALSRPCDAAQTRSLVAVGADAKGQARGPYA